MALGISGARLEQVVKGWEAWFVGIQGAASGRLVPSPGGVIVRSSAGDCLGAVGISGESAAKDLAIATAAMEAVGLVADNAGD